MVITLLADHFPFDNFVLLFVFFYAKDKVIEGGGKSVLAAILGQSRVEAKQVLITPPLFKNQFNILRIITVSDIKLIRTDTTL